MIIIGKQYFCDDRNCNANIMLEEGESITDAGWLDIPGYGQYCPLHSPDVAEQAKEEARGEDEFFGKIPF
jgi:hypothetical protein